MTFSLCVFCSSFSKKLTYFIFLCKKDSLCDEESFHSKPHPSTNFLTVLTGSPRCIDIHLNSFVIHTYFATVRRTNSYYDSHVLVNDKNDENDNDHGGDDEYDDDDDDNDGIHDDCNTDEELRC